MSIVLWCYKTTSDVNHFNVGGVHHKAMQGVVWQVVLHKHTTRCVVQLSVCLHSPPVIVGLSVLYLSCCGDL